MFDPYPPQHQPMPRTRHPSHLSWLLCSAQEHIQLRHSTHGSNPDTGHVLSRGMVKQGSSTTVC